MRVKTFTVVADMIEPFAPAVKRAAKRHEVKIVGISEGDNTDEVKVAGPVEKLVAFFRALGYTELTLDFTDGTGTAY